MGWGWKKRKMFGTRYLHVSVNATQNGMSSVGFKVGPISWNTRTKAFRLDGPGGLYWQQKRARGNRQQRRASGDTKNAGRGKARRRRGPVGAVAEAGVRWVSRGTRFAAVQASARASGYAERVAAPGTRLAERRRTFGSAPVVADLTTGTERRASDVDVGDPVYDSEDMTEAAEAAWWEQRERDADARLRHAMRPARLSLLERAVMRARGDDPAEWLARSAAIDSEVLRARRDRLRADDLDTTTSEPEPTRPELVVAAAGGTEKGDTMSNPVRSITDLADPAIDPHNYAEELPEYLGDAARVVRAEAEAHRERADRLRAEGDALRHLAEYMETAEVEARVRSGIESAAERVEGAASAAATVAEAFEEAADDLAGSARTAEAVYGEVKPPRFDKAG